ncbi:polysaccharide pyruvyl transferase family protein [Microbacterium sp. A82]|uniref:polysaccharide pyruvyl transferase family protein n=1 Tax=Microbacterium sp. A82 TaxID=3450452 RepID=UPI003F2D8833
MTERDLTTGETQMIFRRKRKSDLVTITQNREVALAVDESPSREALEAELQSLLKPRVGITGSLARGNYGDELYVRVYEHWLGQWADLTLLTGIFRPWYFRAIRNNQVDLMDAVVLGGGDLLCPYRPEIDRDFTNPMYLRRPLHVAGIGVERNRPDIDPSVLEQWTEFLTHPNVRSISTRDPGSAEWVSEHIRPKVSVGSHADLVCALPLPPVERDDAKPILGIVTRHIKSPKEYRLLEEIGASYIEKGWRVRHIIGGVAAHGKRDFDNAEELKVDGKETFYTENLDEITRALGECSLVLSMKLHTTLVATMYGVPTVCVNPVVKARAFMAAIGREELALSPTDRRLVKILEDGVPAVPMDKVEELRNQAIERLKSLSQQIWDDYRNTSTVRSHLLPETISWSE